MPNIIETLIMKGFKDDTHLSTQSVDLLNHSLTLINSFVGGFISRNESVIWDSPYQFVSY